MGLRNPIKHLFPALFFLRYGAQYECQRATEGDFLEIKTDFNYPELFPPKAGHSRQMILKYFHLL